MLTVNHKLIHLGKIQEEGTRLYDHAGALELAKSIYLDYDPLAACRLGRQAFWVDTSAANEAP